MDSKMESNKQFLKFDENMELGIILDEDMALMMTIVEAKKMLKIAHMEKGVQDG